MAETRKIVLFDLHGTLVDEQLQLYEGIESSLKELVERDYRLGVVTTQLHRKAQKILQAADVLDLFDAIVGGDDVDEVKPAPEAVFRAMKLLGGTSRQTIIVGDSLRDMQAGRAAGVRVAAALWGCENKREMIAFHPDCLLREPSDLLRICL